MIKLLALLATLAACPATTNPPPAMPEPAPEPAPAPAPTPSPTDQGPVAGPELGAPCGANDTCGAGAECVTYYGIAGPKGPAFKSCEIRCTPNGPACPAGRKCSTVADGPGSVCR
ncbi:MAG: hypothetical protein WKG01_32020 [Kofleriaceae bacterium]